MKAILEKVPQNLSQSFYVGHYKKDAFVTPWHYHPQWELTYIKCGHGVSYIGNSIRYFQEDELVLLGANVPHCWHSEREASSVVESVFVQGDVDMLGEGWLNRPEFKSISAMLARAQQGLLFVGLDKHWLAQVFCDLQLHKGIPSVLSLLSLLEALSESQTESLTTVNEYLVDQHVSERVENIIRYVEMHYMEKIDSAALSELTYMTPTSFSKFFRRAFNKTFTQYLNELRINKACGLIRSSDRPIEDIAFSCGYNNMAFFHRQFKKHMEMTPLHYRKSFLVLGA